MIVQALKEWTPLAPEVLVAAVGGNHGEERLNGQSYTDFADNRDVAVFEDVAEILRENEDRFGHVRFMLPNRDLTLTVDVFGTIVGLAHGHQIQKASGASPAKKAEAWWEGQMTARNPVGDADLLLTGHFHHLVLQSIGPRWHIQMPALHGGSEWFDNVRGGKNPPGQVSLVVGPDGWDHLKVH
jgi:predicted phosphodiesterase